MPTFCPERAGVSMRTRAYCEDCGWQHFSNDLKQASRNEARRHAKTHGHRVLVLNERKTVYEGNRS